MKKEQIVLLFGLMVGYAFGEDNNNGVEVKDVDEASPEEPARLPEWVTTMLKDTPAPGNADWLFLVADNRGRFKIYKGKYADEVSEVFSYNEPSAKKLFGFNASGNRFAFFDRGDNTLKIYQDKNGTWSQAGSKKSGWDVSSGRWVGDDIIITANKKNGYSWVNAFTVMPGGTILGPKPSVPLYQKVVFGITRSPVRALRPAQKLPWYSRLRAYIKQVTGY